AELARQLRSHALRSETANFLARGENENDGTTQPRLIQITRSFDALRKESFHIGGAAPEDPIVNSFHPQRIASPSRLALERYGVEMTGDDQSILDGRSLRGDKIR